MVEVSYDQSLQFRLKIERFQKFSFFHLLYGWLIYMPCPKLGAEDSVQYAGDPFKGSSFLPPDVQK